MSTFEMKDLLAVCAERCRRPVRFAGRRLVLIGLIIGAAAASVWAQGTVIDFATQDPDLLITGSAASGSLGVDLVAGDIDGDGVADLVVGAPWASGPGGRGFAGNVYVFFGAVERPASVGATSADVTIVGAAGLDQLGGSVDRQPGTIAIGDVNGDDVGDLVVGVPDARSNRGEVRVILGRDRSAWEATPVIDLASMPGDVVITTGTVRAWLGTSVAVGDVNGDGFGDVIAGAPRADVADGERSDAGEVFVFFGGESWPVSLVAEDAAGVRVVGAQRGDLLGSGLAVGQLDGTGPDDVAMGARGGAGPADDRGSAGEVHVLFGSPALAGTTRDLSTAPADWVIYAADVLDEAGRYLAVGDVSGDGRPDLVIGMPGGDGPGNARSDAGEVAVVFGPGTAGMTRDLAGGADFIVYGPQGTTPQVAGGRLGDNIALADFDGDGVRDVIAGARQGNGSNGARPNAGEAFVVFGGNLPAGVDLISDDADIAIYGRTNHDVLGRAAAGNLDGAAPDDFALGAYGALSGAGAVFAVYRESAQPTPTATTSATVTATRTPTASPTVTLTPTATSTASVTPTPGVFNYLPLIMRNHPRP